MISGPYSIFKRCMYGRNVHNYALDYVTYFWEAYPDMPKLVELFLSEAHESTSEHVKYVDDDLAKFLLNFRKNNWLKDTTIFLMSDHGSHMHAILRLMPSVTLEMNEPLLISVSPRKQGNITTMYHNAYHLISMYDLRKTILKLTGMNSDALAKQRGYDIFSENVPRNRTCSSAGIPDVCCRCQNS